MKVKSALVVACLFGLGPSQGHAITCEKLEVSKWTGAYYRKLVTTRRAYSGIAAVVQLPQFEVGRFFPFNPDNPKHRRFWEGPMDAASVYLGTNFGGAEIDTGVNRQPVYVVPYKVRVLVSEDLSEPRDLRNKSNWYMLNEVSNPPTLKNPQAEIIARGWAEIDALKARLRIKPLFAYVPFWRTHTWGANPSVAFFPGERIYMTVKYKGHGKFLLQVGLDGDPKPFIQEFHNASFDRAPLGSLAFKRVNSIDQFTTIDNGNTRVGNELGRIPNAKAIPTTSRALGLHWERVSLITKNGTTVPFTSGHCTLHVGRDVAHLREEIFRVYGGNPVLGGEQVDIVPPTAPYGIQRVERRRPSGKNAP